MVFWFKVTVWENLLESNSVLRDLKIKICNGVLGLNGTTRSAMSFRSVKICQAGSSQGTLPINKGKNLIRLQFSCAFPPNSFSGPKTERHRMRLISFVSPLKVER
jgi:hypothetical protein